MCTSGAARFFLQDRDSKKWESDVSGFKRTDAVAMHEKTTFTAGQSGNCPAIFLSPDTGHIRLQIPAGHRTSPVAEILPDTGLSGVWSPTKSDS